MSIQMRGAEVAKAMKEKLIREREELNAAGVNPCLTIIRVGAKENDLAYERGAKKRMEMIGIECRIAELPEDISQEEFDKQLDSIISRDSWIIDGNYQRTLETRIKACDTVFLFDLPTEICIEGALSRIGKKREDMPWFENELDPEFRQWIESFRANQLPEVYRLLEKYKNNREIVVFRTREQADKFIEKLG